MISSEAEREVKTIRNTASSEVKALQLQLEDALAELTSTKATLTQVRDESKRKTAVSTARIVVLALDDFLARLHVNIIWHIPGAEAFLSFPNRFPGSAQDIDTRLTALALPLSPHLPHPVPRSLLPFGTAFITHSKAIEQLTISNSRLTLELRLARGEPVSP